jgi:hypothetical protein
MPTQTKPRAVGLTDSQRAAVLAGAERVPATFRTRYLENVIDRLISDHEPTDGEVATAIDAILSRLGVHAS